MEQSQVPLATVHRRNAPRLKLASAADFTGYNGRTRVILLDLSQTGARIAFQCPPSTPAGFLSWLEYETFGDIIWNEGLCAGLHFDEPIPYEWLIETRARSEHVDVQQRRALLSAAREWVAG